MKKSRNTKDQLIETVIELLRECDDVSEITSRKITERAKINLSTINYYFKSKDELVNIAVNKLLGDEANNYIEVMKSNEVSPKDNLKNFLVRISDMTVDYKKYTKEMMPYILLKGNFNEPLQILPLVKSCLNGKKTNDECKIIAYQLISFMQLIFYRADEFKEFSGINIMNKEERDNIIEMQLDIFLK